MSVPLSITIPGAEAAKFKQRIQETAMLKGWSISELVVEAIAEYLRKHG